MSKKQAPLSGEERRVWEDELEKVLLGTVQDPAALINRSIHHSNMLGIYAESRFLQVMFAKRSKWPAWMVAVTEASNKQNLQEMTDANIYTKYGIVPFQIKHSTSERQKFLSRNRRSPSAYRRKRIEEIVMLVVNKEKTDDEIYEEALALIKAKLNLS